MLKYLLKNIGEIFIGKKLVGVLRKIDKDLPRLERESLYELLSVIFYRLTRVWLIILLVSLLPIILLYQQNKILRQQSELIANQITESQNSNLLIEAERRNSLMSNLNVILTQISNELEISDNGELSDNLIGQICALSITLKPYKFLKNGLPSDIELSPERGELLLFLLNSELNETTLSKIYKRGNFEKADLSDYSLSNFKLDHINLSGADLSNSDLSFTSLKLARLVNTNFYNSNLSYTDFSDAYLLSSNFNQSMLNKTNFYHSKAASPNFFDSIKMKGRLKIMTYNDIIKQFGVQQIAPIAITNTYDEYQHFTIDSILDKNISHLKISLQRESLTEAEKIGFRRNAELKKKLLEKKSN